MDPALLVGGSALALAVAVVTAEAVRRAFIRRSYRPKSPRLPHVAAARIREGAGTFFLDPRAAGLRNKGFH
jgi:hypothetical protein